MPLCSRRLVRLPTDAVRGFLTALRHAWRDGHPGECRGAAARLLALAALSPRAMPQGGNTPTYLLVSHRHLHRPAALGAALRRSGANFVPLIHDVIPLDYPEYGRPAEAERHRRRMATVAALADGVVVNSNATRAAVTRYLPTGLAVHVAPLGIDPPAAGIVPEAAERPYFLCVGTIEPRKNHLLLLHVWRRLVSLHGERTPRLLIVGRRGWENENVLDLLDRCPALRGHVVKLGTVPDSRLDTLRAGARALLMPSFAEGFGLPVAEALGQGTPVICSDLPALREAGGVVPEYLDSLDAPAWAAAILDYAATPSPRRTGQLTRLPAWQCSSWSTHVAAVSAFAERVDGRARRSAGSLAHQPALTTVWPHAYLNRP